MRRTKKHRSATPIRRPRLADRPVAPPALRELEVIGEHITLGQLLKVMGTVEMGGEVRGYLAGNLVTVNGSRESRRGRKLYPGDRVELPDGPVLLQEGDDTLPRSTPSPSD